MAVNEGQCETKDWMVDNKMIDVERIVNCLREVSQQYKIFDTINLLLLFPMVLSQHSIAEIRGHETRCDVMGFYDRR